MLQTHKPIPDAWLARLFDRLTAIYGSQKVGAMWIDADMAQVKAAWGHALAKYPPEAIAVALQDLPEMPSPWPPTLPEFLTLVREASEHIRTQDANFLQLPNDASLADPDSPAVVEFREQLRRFMGRHAA